MRNAGVPIEALIEYVKLFQMGDATFGARLDLLKEQYEKLESRENRSKPPWIDYITRYPNMRRP